MPTASLTTSPQHAAELLRAGKLVAFPTETVYGLGGDALNEHAVAGIFEAKGRPHFDPLIVHTATADAAFALAADVPPIARELAERFWPGPLTLVLPKREQVPDLVTAGLPNVAVRVPQHPFALEMLHLCECPVAAPSANPFGRISPTTAEHVAEQLGDRIDLILDGGPCKVGVESTVLSLIDNRPRLLRPGGVTREEIEAIIGPIELTTPTTDDHSPQSAPGMLSQHYAPRTPLTLLTNWSELSGLHLEERKVGILLLSPAETAPYGSEDLLEVLTIDGDLREAAANFFAALRRLDAENLKHIFAVPFPDVGLGVALNDRLRRAASTVGAGQ